MTILVLCHGNICRSPLAAAVMRRAGLENVTSAGFKPQSENGKRSPKKVRSWAQENESLDLSEHRSQAVTIELLKSAEVILYMDSGQFGRLEKLWTEYELDAAVGSIHSRAFPLGSWLIKQSARIGDPNFQAAGSAAFVEIMGQLVEASTRFAAYWKAQQGAAADPVAALASAALTAPAEGVAAAPSGEGAA